MRHKSILLLAIAAFYLAAVGCQDYALENQTADILVEPEELDFGYVTTGMTLSQEFQIKNVGDKVITVDRFSWDTPVAYFSIDRDEETAFDLASGASVDVDVIFAPEESIPAGNNIVFVHHDVDEEAIPVNLVFEAGSAPDIQADPESVGFGAINSGDTMTEQVDLSNVGSGTIIIGDVTYSGAPEITIDAAGVEGAELSGNDTAVLDVIFSPGGATGAFSGEVAVESNDPDENPLIIPVSGSSGVPFAYCHADPPEVLAIWESSTFYAEDEQGNQSGDPNYTFNELTFNWFFLSTPQGSQVTMPSGTASTRTVTPDMAGTYEAQLTVCNPLEMCSDPCITSFEATMDEDLWVEMYWTYSGDDMDLHLLSPGGTYWDTQSDCHWRNMTPSWGANGVADDPALDLDDISGTGPENINIGSPQDGTYTVIVHDYPGSSYQNSNPTTVRVYIEGVVACEDTRNISGEDSVNYFFEVTYNNGNGVCTPL